MDAGTTIDFDVSIHPPDLSVNIARRGVDSPLFERRGECDGGAGCAGGVGVYLTGTLGGGRGAGLKALLDPPVVVAR
ncbi:hypothetical protein Q7P37_003594 [Cladosporium fusiforme]